MDNPPPVDLGLSISIGLFILSFSWLFAERTNQYPFLRRATAVFSDAAIPDPSSPHFRVMTWGFGHVLFWISAASLSFLLYAMALRQNLVLVLVSLFLGPVFYFLAPQPISASTTLLIVWKVPDDPRLDEAPYLEPYRRGHRARDRFVVGVVASFLLVYAMPAILWMTLLLT